jgi:Amt family ammonium transporter
MSPIYIGAIAGAVCYLALSIKKALKLDDSLDVIAVHLVGGIVGSLLLGFFADVSATGYGFDGVFYGGGTDLLVDQAVAVGSAILYSGIVTLIIAKGVDLLFGLRVDEDAEETGLDLSQHAETAYSN